MKYELVVAAVMSTPWALMPAKLAEISALLRIKAAGGDIAPEEIEAVVGSRRTAARSSGNVAVLPVFGVIHRRASMMVDTSGGVSTEALHQTFGRLMRDPDVGSIVLQIDSPGGSIAGLQELSDLIFSARGEKPVLAVADSLAASAAFLIATAAAEFVVTPSSQTGSVGAMTIHTDISEHEKMDGVKTTIISAGDRKATAHPFAPLSDEDRIELQAKVDEANDALVAGLARNRGVSRAAVNSQFGQGLMFSAKDAVDRGLADRVGTFEDTLARASRMGSRPQRAVQASAETMDWRERRARALAKRVI